MLFSAMNMKNLSLRNVRKYREIKGSDRYVTLEISLKFDSLDNIKVTSSESKEKLERSGKGLINSLGFKSKVRPHKYKKSRYAIGNVSKKYLSNIIEEFDKLTYECYEKKRAKHDPTDRYFFLSRELVKLMMRSDALKLHVYPVIIEINALSSHVCSTDEDE